VKRILSVFLFLSIVWQTKAQDLNCTVEVISNNVQATNRQIFDDLKNSITQFLNNRKWVEDKVSSNERIDCNFVIEITKFDIDQFKANLNIQSSRTAYGSDYNTKIFSTLENNVSFKYAQFQALDFQENNYTDDLTSILAFYTYIIIGQDFDTYSLYGGDPYYRKALAVREAAQNRGQGWTSNYGQGNRNRYFLIDNILDPRFKPLRQAMYQYHLKGLDVMSKNPDKGREEIYQSLKLVKQVYDALPNAFILRLFFNAKTDELISIMSKGTTTQKNKSVELLSKMDPANRSRYEKGILQS
jgi:hypothetical protein